MTAPPQPPPAPSLNQEQVVVFVLAHIERLLSQNTNSLPDLEFSIEITPRAFEALLWLIDYALKGRETFLSVHSHHYLLLAVLRILRHNLQQAVSYKPLPPFLLIPQAYDPSTPKPLGMQIKELALRLFFNPGQFLEREDPQSRIFQLLKEEAAEVLGVAAPILFEEPRGRSEFISTLLSSDVRREGDLANSRAASNSFLFFASLSRFSKSPNSLDLFSFLGKPQDPVFSGHLTNLSAMILGLLKAHKGPFPPLLF